MPLGYGHSLLKSKVFFLTFFIHSHIHLMNLSNNTLIRSLNAFKHIELSQQSSFRFSLLSFITRLNFFVSNFFVGEIWPKPKYQTIGETFYTVRPKVLKFEVNYDSCIYYEKDNLKHLFVCANVIGCRQFYLRNTRKGSQALSADHLIHQRQTKA